MGFVTGFMLTTGWLVFLGCVIAYFWGNGYPRKKMK